MQGEDGRTKEVGDGFQGRILTRCDTVGKSQSLQTHMTGFHTRSICRFFSDNIYLI